MACNPTDIGHASEAIVRVDVEDVLDSESRAEEVTTSSMDDAFGLARGTGCLEPVISKAEKRQRLRLT